MLVITFTGTVQSGRGNFSKRMNEFPEVFKAATGEKLFPGTINVCLNEQIEINEHFRINGSEINEPKQDFLFEVCQINGIWAYRIRQSSKRNGKGAHGDHILDIVCSKKLSNVNVGETVELNFYS